MTTIGSIVSEIICLTNIDTDGGQTDRQADVKRIAVVSYSRGHGPSRKYASSQLPDGVDYNATLNR